MANTTKKKTKLEIISETLRFYKKHPRSVDANDSCLYLGDDGERCAFSRCCKETKAVQARLVESEGMCVSSLYNFRRLLKPEYAGHDEHFWDHVQEIHDTQTNWIETGPAAKSRELSEQGKRLVKKLRAMYKK